MIQPWFSDAKLGIFIHWGIYAVNGIPESWSFFRGSISHEDYMKQLSGFTAAKYDPEAWAQLFKRSGARYAVLTTKHHDGVALWDTRLSDLNVVEKSPAGRDLVGPYCKALRKAGLKVGLYFSHLDWSHPDYASVRHEGADPHAHDHYDAFGYSYPKAGQPDDPAAWRRFLKFHRGQLEELCKRYRPDLLWFDGDWERSDAQWKMKQLDRFLRGLRPKVILNDRMGGHGDYKTPEQGIPIDPPEGPWEFCMTINDSWGYQHKDRNHKSVRQLVRTFAEVIGMGGNLLLDIGPKADGSIPPEQARRLEGLGDWIQRNREAVYRSRAGLPHGHFHGASTLNHKGDCLYLVFFDIPHDKIAVKGIRNRVKAVSVLATGQPLDHRKIGGAPWMDIPGTLWIDLPRSAVDRDATVIKVKLDGPIDLYRGSGQAITAN
jgi:alpha-L-fucosidase